MGSSRFFFDASVCHGNMFLGNRDAVIHGARSVMNMGESSKRRPFFCSPEDLYDEEYYDEQLPEKKRRLTPEQVHLLEKSFEAENKLEPERKTQLAKKLGLQPRQVAVWFQNRRARWKTKQLERDYDLLKSNYDNLLSDYQSIAKENEKLKYEVVSLTEKLQTKEDTARQQPAPAQRPDPYQPETETADAAQFEPIVIAKPEDPLSSGSIGSAVVDEDAPRLVDSCDSYFPSIEYPGCVAPIHPEEDDGSDDGQSCFPDVFAASTSAPSPNNGEALEWWSWA